MRTMRHAARLTCGLGVRHVEFDKFGIGLWYVSIMKISGSAGSIFVNYDVSENMSRLLFFGVSF